VLEDPRALDSKALNRLRNRGRSNLILLEDERQAREADIGLWALPEAQRVPPWEWRDGGVNRQLQPKEVEATPGFTCGAKRYCRELGSCEEARSYLDRCGVKRLDRDGDRVLCEGVAASGAANTSGGRTNTSSQPSPHWEPGE